METIRFFVFPLLCIGPYTPYKLGITAATSVGKGEISPITFFTVEGGLPLIHACGYNLNSCICYV